MIETYVRDQYQKILVNAVATKLSYKIHPNYVTILSAVLGLCIPLLLYFNYNVSAIAALLLSGYCDTLDGTIARFQGKSSPLGTILDIFSDRIVELSTIMGLFLIDPISRGFISIAMLGSIFLCITSFLIVGVFSENDSEKSFYYSPGLMERAEAFFFFVMMILFPHNFTLLGGIFTILVLWTAFFRMYEAIKQFKE